MMTAGRPLSQVAGWHEKRPAGVIAQGKRSKEKGITTSGPVVGNGNGNGGGNGSNGGGNGNGNNGNGNGNGGGNGSNGQGGGNGNN